MRILLTLSILLASSVNTALADSRASLDWQQVSPESLSSEFSLDQNLWISKNELIESIRHSLEYLNAEKSSADYEKIEGLRVSRDDVRRSVKRFLEVLENSSSYQELSNSVAEEFSLYRPSGDTPLPVKFTGYFQPSYQASRTKTDQFSYPIYNAPPDFQDWPKPHPRRIFLEGYSGQGNPVSPIFGKEIAYLSSRWEAFMIHVQGSAILNFPDGTSTAVGFAVATDYPFRGINKSFLKTHNVSWNKLKEFFAIQPDLLNQVLIKNNRYIFFKENPHPKPIGSLGVPVIAERSIATDKSIMPPGALSVVKTLLPNLDENGKMKLTPGMRFVLDQDTGSAIKGRARVDIFMGTGPEAQKKANMVYSNGELYYLLLKD